VCYTDLQANSSQSDICDESESDVQPPKIKRRRRNVICDSDDDRPRKKRQAADSNDSDGVVMNAKKYTSRKQSVRVPWSDQELNFLKKKFGHCLHGGMLPGYSAITEAQKQFPVLQKRSLPQIKSRFYQLQKMLNKNKY